MVGDVEDSAEPEEFVPDPTLREILIGTSAAQRRLMERQLSIARTFRAPLAALRWTPPESWTKLTGGDFAGRLWANFRPSFELPPWTKISSGWRSAEFSELLAGLSKRLYPPNLASIKGLKLAQVGAVLEDGIPLYYVPRQDIAKRLIDAPNTQARRRIIGERFDAIVHDCNAALDLVTNPDYVYEVSATREAVKVIEAGYLNAGQALATTVMDTLMWRWRGTNPEDWQLVAQKQHRGKKGQPLRDIEDLQVWTHTVMRPVYVAHEEFWPHRGDLVPRAFNRNASLHRISYRQYSKRNCAVALMMAASLLVYMDRYGSERRASASR